MFFCDDYDSLMESEDSQFCGHSIAYTLDTIDDSYAFQYFSCGQNAIVLFY